VYTHTHTQTEREREREREMGPHEAFVICQKGDKDHIRGIRHTTRGQKPI